MNLSLFIPSICSNLSFYLFPIYLLSLDIPITYPRSPLSLVLLTSLIVQFSSKCGVHETPSDHKKSIIGIRNLVEVLEKWSAMSDYTQSIGERDNSYATALGTSNIRAVDPTDDVCSS